MKGARIHAIHCDLPICEELKSGQTKVNFSLWLYKYDSGKPKQQTNPSDDVLRQSAVEVVSGPEDGRRLEHLVVRVRS